MSRIDLFACAKVLFLDASNNCPARLDFNGDDVPSLADFIMLARFLFLDGSPPSTPFPECGTPESEQRLRCWELGCDEE